MTSTPEQAPLDAAPADVTPVVPDERLLAAHDLARAALHEITRPETVGAPAGYTAQPDGVVSMRFENTMPGYPGWFWTVSLAVVTGSEPTVLEVELLPGDGALLAPDWVPWAVRLADYQAQQRAAADGSDADDVDAAELPSDEDDDVAEDEDARDEDEDLADLDDLDVADFDDDGSPMLHSGDLDGVDIDVFDEDAPEDEDAPADAGTAEDADTAEGPAVHD